MAVLPNPTLKIVVSTSEDCKSLSLVENTGDYSLINTGGYGTPNISSASVTLLTVNVYLESATIPYAFVFTISSNVISALVLTKPDGTTVNLLSSLVSTAWPFVNGTNPFAMLNTYFDIASDQKMTDGIWTIDYIESGTYTNAGSHNFTLNTTYYLLQNCNACCCVQKMFLAVDPDCGCSDSKLSSAMKAQGFLNAAKVSANAGKYDEASKNLKMAAALCIDNCTGC